jgi:hypothetical protein
MRARRCYHDRARQESEERMSSEELRDTLACEIGLRPAGAPTFGDVADAVRGVCREKGVLVVDFDPAASAAVTALVEAERRCCAGIGWDLSGSPPRLRITATPNQLDALVVLFGRS